MKVVDEVGQSSAEKRLIGHLGLKSVATTDCHEICEKELAELQQELEETSSRMNALQASLWKTTRPAEVRLEQWETGPFRFSLSLV